MKKRLTLKRVALARIKNQKLYNPRFFLSPRRIDIAAKVIFARSYLEKNTSKWPEEVYREHLRAFNNFYEEEPLKRSYDEFKASFLSTIDSIKKDDSWKHKAPVESSKNFLTNGAHRVAASIALNDKVNAVSSRIQYEHSWGYEFFKSDRNEVTRIDEDVLDYITIEYVSLKKSNIFAVVIFPAAEGHRKEAYEHLMKLGEIVNMKTFKHDEFIGKEVIKQLYFDSKNDEWNYGLTFEGASRKAAWCFDGTDDLQVYIIEANLDETTRIKEKEYLRKLWGKEKNSIHITDTPDEANRLVRMFFNENSRRFMKINREKEFASEKMYNLFNRYKMLLPDDVIEREKYAIEGSAVFDLLNIREGKDIDYISRAIHSSFSDEDIEKHDKSENAYHTESIDEILSNPNYYFYYKGYKFIDITEMKKYKENRSKNNDLKDIRDIKKIDRFFLKNPQYNISPQNDDVNLSNEPLFSIIIPLYNKKDHLQECLENVQNQTEENWECIIIDDGSDDGSDKIANNFVKSDARFKVYKQKNAGPSVARNKGIKKSQGKILHFLDADDFYPSTNTLKEIGKIYLKDKPKAIAGNIGVLTQKGGEVNYDQEVNSRIHFYQSFYELQNDYFFTRFFFDKDFIVKNNIIFPEYTYVGEDPVFLVKALSKMDKFLVTDNPVYVYNTIGSSNNDFSKYSDEKLLSYMRTQIEVLEICLKNNYNKLTKNILDRIDRDMIDIYVERMDKNSAIRKSYTKILSFISPEIHHERVHKAREAVGHARNLEIIITNLKDELYNCQYPGIITATKKVGGSVKRKLKKLR